MHEVYYAKDIDGRPDWVNVRYFGEYESIDDAIEAKMTLRSDPSICVSWIKDGASIAHQTYHDQP